MTSQILDYVTVGTALAPVLHAVWNLPLLAGLRRRARRQRVAAVSAGTGICDPAALTVEALKGLPAGAAVHYEGPDGCRLTVWRIAEPSGHRGHGTERGLW
ncbi:hypothetical protein OG604_50825 [Streptomyces sp. NBC_01231]|nr:hypothetical protein OG604_00040 [Streptomyces sp. NBC_01231]WSQ15315.1 hypothetical protein OG604_50825 [Streptomyces sp. NBC_01231]